MELIFMFCVSEAVHAAVLKDATGSNKRCWHLNGYMIKKNSPAKTLLFCMRRLKLQIISKLWCICSTKVLSTIIIVCINGKKRISSWGWLMGFFKRIVHTKNLNYVITYSFSCYSKHVAIFPSSVEHKQHFEGLIIDFYYMENYSNFSKYIL